MCIRDRDYAGAAKHSAAFLKSYPDNALAADVKYVAAESDFCLLYTSDAADERSSVDLGGRRIIKKKKKQDNTGSAD